MVPGQMKQARISGQSGAADAAPNLNGLFTLRRKSRVREHKDRARPHVPLTSVADTAAGSSPSRARTRVESMKSAVAWNVKGVEADARETAREAARRAGLSVGEWLNSVIGEAAGDAAHGSQRDSGRPEGASFSAIHEHLAELATHLGKIGSADRVGARDRPRSAVGTDLRGLETWLSGLSKDLARCSEETPQRVAEAIDRLNQRLEHLIVSGRTAAGEFERRVAAVDHALDELSGETRGAAFPQRATDNPVGDIRARQHALDEARSAQQHREEFNAAADPGVRGSDARTPELDRQLRALSRQLGMMRRPCEFDESVTTLRGDLGRIGDALAKAMPRCALDALETEVQSLANRVDHGRRRGGNAVALSAIEQRLGKVNDVLAELAPAENVGGFQAAVEALSRKIDVLASNGPDVAALQHLETAIAELRRITERVASGEAL